MIVNRKNNPELYDQQYAEIMDYLRTVYNTNKVVEDDISMFEALDYIKSQDPSDHRFIMVPVDEPVFEVDANSRVISVPQVFQRNGLGVKGDHLAETVFFSIARLYDGYDLFNCIPEKDGGCYIQWRLTNGDAGFTKAYSYEATDETIYIGWPISDTITGATGNVEFSLRFFQKAGLNNEIIYSFSTLTAVCPIKPALDLSINDIKPEDLSDIINKRPMYSGVIDSINGAKARIVTDVVAEADLTETLTVGGQSVKVKRLFVDASTPNEGILSYKWFNGHGQLLSGYSEDGTMIESDYNEPYYYATIADTYYCIVGNSVDKYGTRWVQSNTCLIPEASPIEIAEGKDLPTLGYSNDDDDTNDLNYKDKATVHVEFSTGVTGANGEVSHQWYFAPVTNPTGSAKISGATNPIYVPAAGNGDYWCHIENEKNNTVTTIDTEKCRVHSAPAKPTSVTITQQEDGSLLATVLPELPAGDTDTRYIYQWGTADQGVRPDTDSRTIIPTLDEGFAEESFWCRAQQVVFENDPSMARTSEKLQSDGFLIKA